MDIVHKRLTLKTAMEKAGFSTDHDHIDLHLDHVLTAKAHAAPHVGLIAEKVGYGRGFLGVNDTGFIFAQHANPTAGLRGAMIEIPREKTVVSIQFGHDHGSHTLRLILTQPSGSFWRPDKSATFVGKFHEIQHFHRLTAKGPGYAPTALK